MEASSTSSSKNKSLFSNEESPTAASASAEESGWTIYLEDLFASEKRKDEEEGATSWSTVSNTVGGTSMASDAASCAAWKFPATAVASGSRKKLTFKKRKARGVMDDDSLEDTASSPVNSPKVSEVNHLGLNQRKKDENRDLSQEKNIVGFENCTELRRDEMDGLALVGSANECTELKKRGLCLVPLSMLADYLG